MGAGAAHCNPLLRLPLAGTGLRRGGVHCGGRSRRRLSRRCEHRSEGGGHHGGHRHPSLCHAWTTSLLACGHGEQGGSPLRCARPQPRPAYAMLSTVTVLVSAPTISTTARSPAAHSRTTPSSTSPYGSVAAMGSVSESSRKRARRSRARSGRLL